MAGDDLQQLMGVKSKSAGGLQLQQVLLIRSANGVDIWQTHNPSYRVVADLPPKSFISGYLVEFTE